MLVLRIGGWDDCERLLLENAELAGVSLSTGGWDDCEFCALLLVESSSMATPPNGSRMGWAVMGLSLIISACLKVAISVGFD